MGQNITFDFSPREINFSTPTSLENAKNYVYRDINTSSFLLKEEFNKEIVFPPDNSVFDLAAIKNSINNILNFKRGEAILKPEFGLSDIYEYLYSPFDKHMTQKMIKTVRDILTKWEPRIEIVSIPTTYNEDKQEYVMTINYFVPSLKMNDKFQYILAK
jgi:phage baseplate assembly protein W